LVTASVDRIVLKKPILVDADLTIVGAVTWVGRSSMEIQMEVIQPTEGTLVINGVSFVLSSAISAVI
jgi:acyl-coenzyme A thioesterase 9